MDTNENVLQSFSEETLNEMIDENVEGGVENYSPNKYNCIPNLKICDFVGDPVDFHIH